MLILGKPAANWTDDGSGLTSAPASAAQRQDPRRRNPLIIRGGGEGEAEFRNKQHHQQITAINFYIFYFYSCSQASLDHVKTPLMEMQITNPLQPVMVMMVMMRMGSKTGREERASV